MRWPKAGLSFHAAMAAANGTGLQFGDVIVGIDGHAIQSSSDLPLWVAMAVPGQQMQDMVIQAQMGHASIETTMSIYGRAPIRRRVDELGKAFG